MEVLIGDRVRWDWPSGTKRGEVVQIFNTQDEYGDYINFYHIAYSDGFGGTAMAMISENDFEEFENQQEYHGPAEGYQE